MTLIVTQAGLDKVVQADISGISLIIAEVGIGLNGYTPDSTMTALQNESVRKALTGGKQVSSNQIQLQVLLDNEDEIVGREVGFYLDDGTLFAIDSDPDDIITYKSASSGSKALETFDLVLDSLPPDSVTVTVTGDLTVHEDDPNPHPQYELANNNASDSDIDAESTDDKHLNLPQFWRALTKRFTDRTISTTGALSGGGNLSADRTLSIADASTSVKGAVQLSDSTATTSSVLAATATAVKKAYEKGNTAASDLSDHAGASNPHSDSQASSDWVVVSGQLWNGNTVPIPAGFALSDCEIIASMKWSSAHYWDINENGSWNHIMHTCAINNGVLDCHLTVYNSDGNTLDEIPARATYLLVGRKGSF